MKVWKHIKHNGAIRIQVVDNERRIFVRFTFTVILGGSMQALVQLQITPKSMRKSSALTQLLLENVHFVLEPEYTNTHPAQHQWLCICITRTKKKNILRLVLIWLQRHTAVPVSILLTDLFVLLQLQNHLCLLLRLRLQLPELPRPLLRIQLRLLQPGVL